ncbi:glycoside hydrolase family 113 [Algoriphagus namhaensis]
MGKLSQRYLLSSIGLILIVLLSFFLFPMEEKSLVKANHKWKGVCWVGSRNPLEGGELAALHETGADALSQTPFAFQPEVDNPDLRWSVYTEEMWWGESARGISATLDSSRVFGITNILKPHIWVRNSWPGEIEMENEQDWNSWFENYSKFILDYAQLAEDLEIPVLCIGTELEKTTHREKDWREVIAKIRKVYGGQLVYAANFTEFEKVKFWDALDYIGVQAYFPLAEGQNPNLETLKKGWNQPIAKLEKLLRKFEKPVIFTEIGYCNTVDAATEPWVWPKDRQNAALSDEVQARCYQAFFETVWKKEWMAGVFFWKWYPNERYRDPDFTPQGKAAEQVLTEYFTTD